MYLILWLVARGRTFPAYVDIGSFFGKEFRIFDPDSTFDKNVDHSHNLASLAIKIYPMRSRL